MTSPRTPWDKATALHCLNILQEVREQIVHADGVDYGILSRAEYRLQKFADSLPSEKVETVDGFDIRPILLEVMRSIRKFPTWPTDPLHALAVLGEEFGELTKAMVQLTYEPHKTSAEEVQKEALQTAAMALRLCHSLNRYEYKPGVQHEQ